MNMLNVHPAYYLFSLLPSVTPYPKGVCGIDKHITGTAFFPGGDGLWKESHEIEKPEMPIGKIMILGHNFDNAAGFLKSVRHCTENMNSPTWRNLLKFLKAVNVHPSSYFFTNIYMGIIEVGSNVGQFPGSRNPAFVERCLKFLKVQLTVLRPSLILTLGSHVPPLISKLASNLDVWRGISTLRSLDEKGISKVVKIKFTGIDDIAPTVVALTHPAQRHLNVGTRHYGSTSGHDAEVAMVNEAILELGLREKGLIIE
jgi:hypothetical protein